VVRSLGHLTLDFGSGRGLGVVGLSPALGSALSGERLEVLSVPLFLPPTFRVYVHTLSLKKQTTSKFRPPDA